uniref:Uncharacterized protein n=1 Tax=Anguilla anguilla TaxID=7936 RepID=A0A0E9T8Q4_ANGAN
MIMAKQLFVYCNVTCRNMMMIIKRCNTFVIVRTKDNF